MKEEKIAFAYDGPAAPPTTVPGAEKVSLSIVGADKRAQRTDSIATKSGWSLAHVSATTDIVEVVRSAVEKDLKAQGFSVGGGDLTVIVELQNFYDVIGAYSTSASGGRVAFTLRVKDRSGLTRYAHYYEGASAVGIRWDQSAELSNELLQKALADILNKMNGDTVLQSALLQPAKGR